MACGLSQPSPQLGGPHAYLGPGRLNSRLCRDLPPLPGETLSFQSAGWFPTVGNGKATVGDNDLQREARTQGWQPSLAQHKAPTFPK